ncbi:MAG: hypothetical protein GIW98_00380 [Candidatus Eremiobacteraeota bacterium]|nr:hypothetical protein [Candidatus Eremiobacteraeota bacterium]
MDDQEIVLIRHRTMLIDTVLDVVAVELEKAKIENEQEVGSMGHELSPLSGVRVDGMEYELQLLKDLDNSAIVTKEFEGDGYWKRNVA